MLLFFELEFFLIIFFNFPESPIAKFFWQLKFLENYFLSDCVKDL